MYIHIAPQEYLDWIKISEPELERFLSGCEDYRREAYANMAVYYYSRGGEPFARIFNDNIYVAPHVVSELNKEQTPA